MSKRWILTEYRSVLKRFLLVAACIALPVIAWAQWSTSGSNIYNNNGGNVGIGTSSPGVALELAQNTAFRLGNVNISSGSGGNYAHFGTHVWYDGTQWHTDGSTGAIYQIDGQVHGWWKHDGYGNFTQMMTISASGNVGIGVASPSSKLDVAGDVSAPDRGSCVAG